MFSNSIRWRIQAWHSFLLVCLVTALTIGFYQYERNIRLREIDNRLHETLTPILPFLAPPPGGGRGPRNEGRPRDFLGERGPRAERPPHEMESGEPPQDGPGQPPAPERQPRDGFAPPENSPEAQAHAIMEKGLFYYVSWSPELQVLKKSDNAPKNIPLPKEDNLGSELRTHDSLRELIQRLPSGNFVLVGTSLAALQAQLRWLAWWLTGAGIVVVAIGLTVGWWLAGRALKPIAQISATADKISGGDLSKRINVEETENELGQLAAVLNTAFERLEKNLEEQQRFTADASHELRTPISVIITQIQLALSRERTPEEYRKTLETCERAAERMRTLANQLIELARIDCGDASLVWEKCDLGRVARDAIEFIQPLAEKKNVTLKTSIDAARTKADVMKLGQVLINLLNNAIHHNKEGVEVSLSLQRNGEKAIFRIQDNGAGIPAEALPHLFDRFYRVDKSRARGKGNSGLGLAICKAIVEGHRGTIRAESEPGKGATFIIELPLSEKESERKWVSSPV